MNNIFDYATSELSQDAFLCYLFNFASKEYEGDDQYLNQCAVEVLRKIISSKYSKEIKDENITVTQLKKQYRNIDVYIQVNDKYHIILEDKTYTSQHSDQVERYKDLISNEGKANIITVYYKIIGQAHPEDVNIHITRKDMLAIMAPYIDKSNNTIFSNYYHFLRELEERVQKFETLPVDKWTGDQYRGFFDYLTDDENNTEGLSLDRGYGWGYVPNPRGGFHGLWWYFSTPEELNKTGLADYNVTDLYLQIEDDSIVIKIVSEDKINNLKWEIYNYITESNLVSGFEKKRFHNGKVMSIGYIEYDENNYQEKIKVMENVLDKIRNGSYTVTL
ncbi:PD-(D/E)XK nuclease superfamily protein [Alkalibacterium putridalgicola]|uniref:PD-(D/E)XK nuclease superfamily protein n=1 Tax=Alkalibacterium putridalgicola TaxID=426703 RepID=A0A1H7SAR0_9LACT|nr:PD-(D/E)XK nuclease family protein [Alkalibacterium putridalgicola]GEK89120.1 hypothetical protein APU01nite_11590 [Alkalibacterium putridalgicola]SEL69316.1 PD-(D/E)XK nuclease superfamily protein [Alkalibacterium putridalgicola]